MTESKDRRTSRAQKVVFTAIGLGCMLAYCRAFATGFAGDIPMAGQPEMQTFSAACSAARVAAIALVVVLGCAWRVSIGRTTLVVSGVVMAIAAFALSGGCTVTEGMPFALIAGVASGVVMLAMMLLLSNLGIRDIVLASFGGMLIGGVLIGGLMRLDALPALAILMVSGVLSGLCFLFADPQLESCRADGIPHASQLSTFPWFATIAFIVGGMAASLFYGASIALGWNAGVQMNYPLFGIAIVLVLGTTVYIVLQGEEAVGAAWVPLFAVLLLSMVFTCFDDAELAPSVLALLMASVFSYHFLRWLVFPALISFSRMPRLIVCGAVLVLTSSVFGVGWGEATALTLPDGLRDQGSFVAFVALDLLVILAATLWVNRSRLERERMQRESLDMQLHETRMQLENAQEHLQQLSEQAAASAETPVSSIDERCAALSATYDLTAREAEIFGLTARGHSSTYIAEQLFISASTVRFHQQNIYRKLDVHSRQELLSLVNEEEAS